MPNRWIEYYSNKKQINGKGSRFSRPAAAPPAPPPPQRMEPLEKKLPTSLVNKVREYGADTIRRVAKDPEGDAKLRQQIEAYTQQLNQPESNQMLKEQKRRNEIYPKIYALLTKIIIKTPEERQLIELWGSYPVYFKDHFFRL